MATSDPNGDVEKGEGGGSSAALRQRGDRDHHDPPPHHLEAEGHDAPDEMFYSHLEGHSSDFERIDSNEETLLRRGGTGSVYDSVDTVDASGMLNAPLIEEGTEEKVEEEEGSLSDEEMAALIVGSNERGGGASGEGGEEDTDEEELVESVSALWTPTRDPGAKKPSPPPSTESQAELDGGDAFYDPIVSVGSIDSARSDGSNRDRFFARGSSLEPTLEASLRSEGGDESRQRATPPRAAATSEEAGGGGAQQHGSVNSETSEVGPLPIFGNRFNGGGTRSGPFARQRSGNTLWDITKRRLSSMLIKKRSSAVTMTPDSRDSSMIVPASPPPPPPPPEEEEEEEEEGARPATRWSIIRADSLLVNIQKRTSSLLSPGGALSFRNLSFRKKPEKGHKRTPSQMARIDRKKEKMQANIRSKLEFSLTQCSLAIVGYLVVAVIAYSFVFERWPIVDSLYFAMVTFTTIGYGDLCPTTTPGRVFTSVFAMGGVACLGIALGVLGSNLIEAEVKVRERAHEATRDRMMRVFERTSRTTFGKTTKGTAGEEEDDKPKGFCGTLLVKFVPIFVALLLGSYFVAYQEGWDWGSALYYGVITACTIGYGDLTPDTTETKWFMVFFIPVAVGAMGEFLGEAAGYIIGMRQSAFRERLKQTELSLDDLEVMDTSGDGLVTKSDYMEFMLVSMGKIDRDLVDELHGQFDRLDVDGSGVLSKEDLKLFAKKKLKGARKKLELRTYKMGLLEAAASKTRDEGKAACDDGDGLARVAE